MASVFDLAEAILEQTGEISTVKLQKLVYYCQVWNSVWEDKPIFNDQIEAWAFGPVVPNLYNKHRGQFSVKPNFFSQFGGNSNNLSKQEKENIAQVITHYSKYNSQQLSDMTHLEDPWRIARAGLPDGTACNNEISLNSIMEYYSKLNG